jgi:signal transduction histidine kinase
LASGKLEWTTDLQHDLVERRAAVAEDLGISTAVACPVLLGEQVVAVLEFFSDRVVQPNCGIADAMLDVGLQLGRVIERAAFEEHLLTIAEDIQQGIAQDLHDDIGQELTGLSLKAATLADLLAPATTPRGKLAADIASALDRTHDKVRGVCRGMLPIELEEGLLSSALEQLAAATSESSRVGCKFICRHPDPVLESRVSMHLYRIAQEAVANAVRHSRARRIRIVLAWRDGETTLRIEDDGTGLSSDRAQVEGWDCVPCTIALA